MKKHAEYMAACGFRVFPRIGKGILPKSWPEIATTDPMVIGKMFAESKWKNADGYGIVTGLKSGIVVIDEDPNVVVTGELKCFSPLVGKAGMEFKCEVIVVWTALIPEQLPIYRKEGPTLKGEDSRPWRRLCKL